MDNCTNFNDLSTHLRVLFKSAAYSSSTVRDMEFILGAFSDYMNENGLNEYSPEIGEKLISYCKETLKVCSSRVTRAKIIVSKLNRLYQGFDGDDALWANGIKTIELPEDFSDALKSFIFNCQDNGNTKTTIHYKQWICTRFLKNLESLGCKRVSEISGELIQSAFLQLGYSRYWGRISQFLYFIFESGRINHDYSKLIVNRKKFVPHPTVYKQEEIAEIEKSINTTSAVGIRNYAIVLLLSRYGIRSRDIAAMTFENLDFVNDRIHFIQQKTGVLWEMMLFPEVKLALQNYIEFSRPKIANCNNVFLTALIPYKPLSGNAIDTTIGMIVSNSNVNTNEKRHGSRSFRSSIASNMVNDNVPTKIVRKVLGHGTKYAIQHYAKIDIESMRLCPLQPPQPSGAFSRMIVWKEKHHHV